MNRLSRSFATFVAGLGVAASGSTMLTSAPISAQRGDAGAASFSAVASVLSSPRCANCHIAGDAPLQGEDGRPHPMNVRRGTDGRGTVAMRCTNCHQETSSVTPHGPPGAPDWRLPPAATPMAWRGLSVGDQCRLLMDRARNGNRGVSELLEHLRTDGLVISSWNPGPGRPVPPMSHEELVRRFREWIDAGARCPE